MSKSLVKENHSKLLNKSEATKKTALVKQDADELKVAPSQDKVRSEILVISISLIDDPPLSVRSNPRVGPDFVSSVEENGIMEPIIVRPTHNGRYQRISGQRRLVAAKEIGLAEIECKVMHNLDERQVFAFVFQENMHEHPDYMDIAEYVVASMEKLGISQKQAAKLAKIEEKRLSNILRVYKDGALRERVRNGLTFDAAVELLALKPYKGEDWNSFACETQLTNREAIRREVQKAKGENPPKRRRRGKCSFCDGMMENLELKALRLCQGDIKNFEEFQLFLPRLQEIADVSGEQTSRLLKRSLELALINVRREKVKGNSDEIEKI